MSTYVEKLDLSVPAEIAPAINHLIARFTEEFYYSGAEHLCIKAMHNVKFDWSDREDLEDLLAPTEISPRQFLRSVLSRREPSVLNAFRFLWQERTRQHLRSLFDDLLEVAYANHINLPKPPPTWAGQIAMKTMQARSVHFTVWTRNVCEATAHNHLDPKDWLGPKLLRMEPLGSSPYAPFEVWERLDPESTRSTMERLKAGMDLRIARLLRDVIGEAELEWAKRPKPPQSLEDEPNAASPIAGPDAAMATGQVDEADSDSASKRKRLIDRVRIDLDGSTRTEDAAEIFGITPKTVNRWVDVGTLSRAAKRGFISNKSIVRNLPKSDN